MKMDKQVVMVSAASPVCLSKYFVPLEVIFRELPAGLADRFMLPPVVLELPSDSGQFLL